MNKLKLSGNPIDILFEVIENEYPETAKRISKIGFAIIEEGAFGVTKFNDDGTIEIYISPTKKGNRKMDFETATELLAHEFAHAIVGIEAEHGEKWQKEFDNINTWFYAYVERGFL